MIPTVKEQQDIAQSVNYNLFMVLFRSLIPKHPELVESLLRLKHQAERPVSHPDKQVKKVGTLANKKLVSCIDQILEGVHYTGEKH